MKRTKKRVVLPLIACLILGLCLVGCGDAQKPAVSEEPTPVAPANPLIRLSTTTSVNDSGLLGYLQPEFEQDTGYVLEIVSAGSGAAIEKGRTGDADCLLVHSPAAEETFIGEGFDEERVTFMYNYYVIVGPEDDPAGVKDCTDASEAFAQIAETDGAQFVSRGDDSGTHNAEKGLWTLAGIDPEGQDWYISTGSGMGASLVVASETGAYILTDKATYLAHELRDTMSILLEKSSQMQNTYSLIAISDKRWEDTNKEGSDAFISWMTSEKALTMIDEFGVAQYGEQLFFTYD